jgi:hypothetical protein
MDEHTKGLLSPRHPYFSFPRPLFHAEALEC